MRWGRTSLEDPIPPHLADSKLRALPDDVALRRFIVTSLSYNVPFP